MNCKTCKFWNAERFRLNKTGNCSTDDTKNEGAGTCRHDAPASRANNFRAWPVTLESDFCHEWEGRSEVPPSVSAEPAAVSTEEPQKSLFGRKKKSVDKPKP